MSTPQLPDEPLAPSPAEPVVPNPMEPGPAQPFEPTVPFDRSGS